MPDEQLEREETLSALREELLALPSDIASLLALYHFDGQSVAEIARVTKISVDACKQRLSRGREELRQRIGTVNIAVDLIHHARNP